MTTKKGSLKYIVKHKIDYNAAIKTHRKNE